MPLPKTLGVLIGFPIGATLISFLLLKPSLITDFGLNFYYTFWTIIILWYIAQIFVIQRILRSSGWTWSDIGYSFNKKKTIFLCAGYLVFAFGLLFFVEYTLAHSEIDPQKLESIVQMSPRTTTLRVIFIFLGLVAGISEEIVYRGFAIKALTSNKINKWLAVFIAAIPFLFQHGIKAYHLSWGIWFFVWGIVFGILFLLLKKLYVNIIIHWLVILSAMLAILQVVE